jgi:hypothetical protein
MSDESKENIISDLFQKLKLEDPFTQRIIKHISIITDDTYFIVFEYFVNYINIIFNILKCMVLINNTNNFTFRNAILKFLDNYKRFNQIGESKEIFETWKYNMHVQRNQPVSEDPDNKYYFECLFNYCYEFRKLNSQLEDMQPKISTAFTNIIDNITKETENEIMKSKFKGLIFLYELIRNIYS